MQNDEMLGNNAKRYRIKNNTPQSGFQATESFYLPFDELYAVIRDGLPDPDRKHQMSARNAGIGSHADFEGVT